jgi:tryptophan-rich sensory protein
VDPLILVLLVLIAGIGAALGWMIFRYSASGCLVVLAGGFIGAVVGVALVKKLGLPRLLVFELGGHRFPLVWMILSAVMGVLAVSLLWKTLPRRPRRF